MVYKIHFRMGVYLTALAGASLTTLLIACSSGVPSETDGRKVLENVAKSRGVYEVRTFTKTNAVLDQNGGTYRLEFEADVECQKVNTPSSSSGVFNYTFPLIERGSLYVTCGETGQKQKLSDTLLFEKTEKGWRGMDGEVY